MGEFFKCIGVTIYNNGYRCLVNSNINFFPNLIKHAISRKWKGKSEKRDHWLDFADDKYDKQFIDDVKRVLSVGFVFIPLPVFWALYDQQVI